MKKLNRWKSGARGETARSIRRLPLQRAYRVTEAIFQPPPTPATCSPSASATFFRAHLSLPSLPPTRITLASGGSGPTSGTSTNYRVIKNP